MEANFVWSIFVNSNSTKLISRKIRGAEIFFQFSHCDMYECPHQNVYTIFFFSGSFIVFWVTCWLSAFGLEDHMMHKAECQMWSKLENKTLPLQDQGHANCTTNSQCTGFDCKGIYQVSNKIVHLVPLL